MPKKEKGECRLVVDYRGLNEQTERDSYSLPLMDSILQKQQKKRIFTVLDLKHRYHQMPLHPDSRPCTAMSTPLGPMQWKVVPMGAKNGNATFQRMMEDLLGPVRDCADPFVDDIIIGSGTENMTGDELIEAQHGVQAHQSLTLREGSGVCGSRGWSRETPSHAWEAGVPVGAHHRPLGLHALWGLRATGVVGGCPRGGRPATFVRDVWCQALSLSQPPVLWGGQPAFRGPCVPGAVGAGVGPSTGPTACALEGRRCLLPAWRKGVPGGMTSTIVRGVFGQALPLPELPAHWAGCSGPPPTCCGRGCVGVGAQHCPLGLHTLWGLRAAGVVGGRPRGRVACHRCERFLVSGAVPPKAARPLGRAVGFPQPAYPGCGRCGHGDQAPAPQRAPLRAGVARCGSGGRASPGGGLPPL